jgi:UPF0716 protein FxsA
MLFLYPFVEIYLLIRLIEESSFLTVLFYLVVSGFLGASIMRAVSKQILMPPQSVSSGATHLESKLMHRIVIFLGGLFIFLPGVISKVIGVIFVLPGFRHLAILMLRGYVLKVISTGALRVFKFGEGGVHFSSNFGSNGSGIHPQERDAKVVDIEVIDIQKNRIE